MTRTIRGAPTLSQLTERWQLSAATIALATGGDLDLLQPLAFLRIGERYEAYGLPGREDEEPGCGDYLAGVIRALGPSAVGVVTGAFIPEDGVDIAAVSLIVSDGEAASHSYAEVHAGIAGEWTRCSISEDVQESLPVWIRQCRRERVSVT